LAEKVKPEDGPQVKPLAATLQEIAAGTFHAKVSDELRQLTAAVTDTGKKGTLVVTLTVAPIKPGNTTNLVVTAQSALKAPAGDAPSAVFFSDQDGNLTREDPNQPMLPMRVVGKETA
jgi:hypothetical protein